MNTEKWDLAQEWAAEPEKNADQIEVESERGKGTRVRMVFFLKREGDRH